MRAEVVLQQNKIVGTKRRTCPLRVANYSSVFLQLPRPVNHALAGLTPRLCKGLSLTPIPAVSLMIDCCALFNAFYLTTCEDAEIRY